MFKNFSQDSQYSWFRLLITFFIGTSLNIGMWAIVIVLPDIQKEFNFNRGEVSVLFSFTMVGFALGNFILGKLVDKYGILYTLLFAALTVVLGFFISAISYSLLLLSFCHIMIGFGTAAGFGPLMSDISFWFSKRRGIAVAIAASGNYFSGIIWPTLISSFFPYSFDWRFLYILFGIIAVILTVPLSFLLTKKIESSYLDKETKEANQKLSEKFISPRLLLFILVLASIACCVAMSMPQIHIVALCVDLGFSPIVGTNMLSLMLTGGVISRIISGVAVDYFGGFKVLLVGSSLQCLALFLYLPFDGITSLYLVSLIFGLSQGGIVPSYAVILREYLPPQNVASKIGLVLMATIFGMAFGGWISGVIFDLTGSYNLAFLNGIIWNFINIILIIYLMFKGNNNKTLVALQN